MVRTGILATLTAAAIGGAGAGAYFHQQYDKLQAVHEADQTRIMAYDSAAQKIAFACNNFEEAVKGLQDDGYGVAASQVAQAKPQGSAP